MVRQKSLRVRLIEMCRDGHFTLQFMLDRLGIKPEVLSRWFTQRRFRRDLAKAMVIAHRRHRLEMRLNAHKAGVQMGRTASGNFDRKNPPLDVQRLGCMNQVLATAMLEKIWQQIDKAAQRARPGKDSPEPARDLAHPDIAHHADELLAELEAARGNREG